MRRRYPDDSPVSTDTGDRRRPVRSAPDPRFHRSSHAAAAAHRERLRQLLVSNCHENRCLVAVNLLRLNADSGTFATVASSPSESTVGNYSMIPVGAACRIGRNQNKIFHFRSPHRAVLYGLEHIFPSLAIAWRIAGEYQYYRCANACVTEHLERVPFVWYAWNERRHDTTPDICPSRHNSTDCRAPNITVRPALVDAYGRSSAKSTANRPTPGCQIFVAFKSRAQGFSIAYRTLAPP